MAVLRRAFGIFLLVCVGFALGDAPSLDQFFELAATSTSVQLAAHGPREHDTTPAQPSPGSSKICGHLLILSCATGAIEVAALEGGGRFPARLRPSYTSTNARRIDRPPAPTVQA